LVGWLASRLVIYLASQSVNWAVRQSSGLFVCLFVSMLVTLQQTNPESVTSTMGVHCCWYICRLSF